MEKQESTFRESSDNSTEYLLCSDCFRDEGLKIKAFEIGVNHNSECKQCHLTEGKKLTKDAIHSLCYDFFVKGTSHKVKYGGAPTIQFNEYRSGKTEIQVSSWLTNDVKLIEQAGELGLFYYGPRLWTLGEIEPLKALQSEAGREVVIDRILSEYPVIEFSESEHFYRVRRNPKKPDNELEYDSPPEGSLGANRLDSAKFPVLYASIDLELCIHECRATVSDNLYVSKLMPLKALKLLNLSADLSENVTEFESLGIAVYFLFMAEGHSYDICRHIAIEAERRGFDGIIYPSFFSHVRASPLSSETSYGASVRITESLKDRTQAHIVPNIALFGRPVSEKNVRVDCINRVLINRVSYGLSFGPVQGLAVDDNIS